MATDPYLKELAGTLKMEDIPVKLRCAACNMLAVGAFRTPCCDQCICEDCQSTFPEACPICLHEPVKAEDCRPNKTLRLTTRAFLKKLAAQREQGQKKIAAATAAGPPATVPTSHNDGLSASTTTNFLSSLQQADGTQISQEAFTTSPSTEQTKPLTIGEPLPTEAQKDVPQPSIEATEDRVREESFQEQDRGDVAASNQDIQNDGAQQPQSAQNMQPQAMTNGTGAGQGMNGTGFGFDGMTNGFPTMAFTNGMDFNSMTQFMPNNAMGGFPNMMGMPGMPGMGMDPMQAMSQGMFGGFGGPGMGMNGVNAGMGFPAGQTWNGGFNGQPGSWMSGQDKFNQNAYGGHANGMGGDFGANAGYSGYNQGNYNQMNPHQFPNHDFQNGYHGQGFHSRGRGRGRGYHPYAARGRGSYNQVNGSYANHEPFHHQSPSQHPRQDTSYSQNPQQIQDGEKSQVDEFGRDISGYKKTEEPTDEQLARSLAPGDADEHEGLTGPNITAAEGASTSADANGEPPKPSAGPSAPIEGPKEPVRDGEKPNEMQQEQQKDKPALIETVVSDEATRAEPTSPSSAVTANTMLPPPTPAIPQNPRSSSRVDEKSYEYNARGRFPNGPSEYRGTGRDRGSTHATSETTNHIRTGFQPAVPPVTAPIEPKGLGVEGAPKGPKAMREGLPNTGIRGGRGFSIVGRAAAAVHSRPNGNTRSRSRSPKGSRSRSPSRHHSHRHRSHRHRSPEASDSSENERERRRERHERHKRRSCKYEESEEEKDDHTSATHRSSRRSRRERDDDREEDDKSHHRSHRSRHEPDRDGESRSIRKRSRTPPPATAGSHEAKPPEPASSTSSSRKRRDGEHGEDEKEEYEQARRDRKRSRRDYAEEPSTTKDADKLARNNSHVNASDHKATHSSSKQHPSSHKPQPPSSSSKAATPVKETEPAIDPHELERQARNKERMQKEMQRREAMEGKGPGGGRSNKHQNHGASLSRRVSYKYEDELEGHDRVEREREAGRWG